MSSFIHTEKALDVLASFHRADVVIYVEGRDDKLFWSNLAGSKTSPKIYFKIAGCQSELAKLISAISEDDSSIIVASDNDYSEILNLQTVNDRVIYTFGYSIENTLYCPKTIGVVVAKYGRSTEADKFADEVSVWYQEFCADCMPLLVYDLASVKSRIRVEVMGGSSHRFLVSGTSCNLSKRGISSHIDSIGHLFSKKEIAECESLVRNDGRDVRYLIRGHFLTSAIIKLIKKLVIGESGRRISVSKDTLFTLTVDNCLHCGSECEEISKMRDGVERAIKSLSDISD